MLKLALRMLRHRLGTSVATLLALAAGVTILMTLAVFIASAAVHRPAAGRYAAADVVVAHRELTVTGKDLDGSRTTSTVALPDGTVPADLGDRLRTLPGVAAVQIFPGPTPERADSFGVRAEPGADITAAVRRLAGEAGAETYAGDDRGWADRSAAVEARSLLLQAGSAFGGYVLLLIVFVVTGTVGLAVRHRRRDLALLRAVAATPRQVRRLVLAETGLIALAAAALGVPAGFLAIRWTQQELLARGFVPEGFPLTGHAAAAGTATLVIVLVAVLAARIAARRITRIRPAEALGEIAVERSGGGRLRLASGLVVLAAAGASMVLTAGAAGMTALAAAVGMLYLYVLAVALLAPWLNGFAARVLAPVLRRVWGIPGDLAVANLRANARGMAAVLSALVLAVGFGGSVWFLQDNVQRQTVTQSRDGMLADRALVAPGGLPSGAAEEIRRMPGVEAATGVRHTSVVVRALDGAEPVVARAVDPAGLSSTMDPGVRDGSLTELRGDTVAVSRLQASSSGWRVGEQAAMWLGDGTPVSLRVIAIYDRGLGFGDVLLPRELVAGPDDEVLVRGGAALAYPGAEVVPAAELTGRLSRDLAVSAWLNKLLIGVMVGYAALAAGNTMVMAALARGRELALLQLAGLTRRQVRRMVNAEQVGLLGVALTVGGTIAALTLAAVVNALTGRPVPYVPPAGGLVVLGGTVVLALVTTILPVARLLRVPPVRNAGTRE